MGALRLHELLLILARFRTGGTSNFWIPSPFSMSIHSLCHRCPSPRRCHPTSIYPHKKGEKEERKRGKRLLRALLSCVLFRNVSCGGHFRGAFSPCAKLRRRTSFRKLSNNLLAPPNETIHFTGRNLPLFREARSQLFIIYIQEYHAHTIFVPMHLSYWSCTRAFHLRWARD